jgi:hypothetical protein
MKFLNKVVASTILYLAFGCAAKANQLDAVKRALESGDPAVAFRICTLMAEAGDPEAQLAVGTLFAAGIGTVNDDAKALSWYLKAAEQGERNAMFTIGVWRQIGRGSAPDPVVSGDWLFKAALLGHADAQYSLALRYATGFGVQRNELAAVRWMRRAAQQGVTGAQVSLARMLASAHGVPMDKMAAYSWASIALKKNEDQAAASKASELVRSLLKDLKPEEVSQAQKLANQSVPQIEAPLVPAITSGERDGILATLRIQAGEAVVSWRPTSIYASTPVEISGADAAVALGSPLVETYPGPDATTSLLFLVDVSSAGSKAEIEQSARLIATIAGHAQFHHQIDVAVFSDNLQMLTNDKVDLGTALGIVQSAAPTGERADIIQIIDKAIDLSASALAYRRGVFVLTNGDIADPSRVVALAQKARLASASVTIVNSSAAQEKSWENISKLTGGQVVGPDRMEAFLKDPFRLLDAGAAVHFPIERPENYPYGPPYEAKIALRLPETRIDLTAKVNDKLQIELTALESVITSCDASCTQDLKKTLLSRIELLLQDYRVFKAAQNSDLLRRYARECVACGFRDEAEARITAIETQGLYVRLDVASSRDAIEALLRECGERCPSGLYSAALARLQEATTDEAKYLSARSDLESLKAYVDACENCPFAPNARQDIKVLELDKLQHHDDLEFESARGNVDALRRYVNMCTLCSHAAEAREGIDWLEGKVQRPDPTQGPWIAIAGSITSGRNAHSATGYSGVTRSEEDARFWAMASCRKAGGENCRIVSAANSGCLYITAGSNANRVSWGSGPTGERATKQCRSGGFACRPPIGGCIE